ncbi:leucine-rich repeat receptor-like protein kinase [Populus alba x Populus x berolinensis]|nr:leucine-rich repeat receptor-like protein kinase [Populus alba x Populus x berolinensis]
MASIDYEPKLLAILSISFFLSCIFVSVAALDDSALLASEGKALLESGWWSDYSNLTSYRCEWTGIACDRAGSITEMFPPPELVKVGNKFAKMNFSCFSNLARLELANHELSGSMELGILPQISILPQLRYLDLSSNNLTGSLTSLRTLYLSNNQINGSIPSSLKYCNNLASLDLSFNNLCGEIPSELYDLYSLKYVNFSYNNLSGPVPLLWQQPFDLYLTCDFLHSQRTNNSEIFQDSAFEGNKYLHPDFSHCPSIYSPPSQTYLLPSKDNRRIDSIKIFLTTTISLCLLCLGYCYLSRRKATQAEPASSKNGDLFSVWNYDGTIAYEDIITATENFDLRYCIGIGGYGSVYRAQLPSGKLVALKKLHRREAEEPAFDKSFKNEVEVLTQIRHRSIVKLYGFCLHQRCMFLVYEYMEKGSLFCALRNDVRAVELKWMKRARIIKDIAHALSYLHHDCNP